MTFYGRVFRNRNGLKCKIYLIGDGDPPEQSNASQREHRAHAWKIIDVDNPNSFFTAIFSQTFIVAGTFGISVVVFLKKVC